MFKLDKFEVKSIKEVFSNKLFYVGTVCVFLWSFGFYGLTLPFIGAVIFGSILLIFSIIDFKHFILPDILMLPALLIGLVAAPMLMGHGWLNTFAGGFLGFGLFFAVSYLFFKIKGYHGIGFGDVKFLGVLGAWVGAINLPPLLLIASFVAIPVFILRKIIYGTETSKPLPFGPFLAIGGWLMLLYNVPVWHFILKTRETIIQGITG